MHELRGWLYDVSDYQATDAPPMSLRYAHYSVREGWLMDLSYERKVCKAFDEEERLKSIPVMEEVIEEMEDMKLDDDSVLLENNEPVRAADAEVSGEDVNIT